MGRFAVRHPSFSLRTRLYCIYIVMLFRARAQIATGGKPHGGRRGEEHGRLFATKPFNAVLHLPRFSTVKFCCKLLDLAGYRTQCRSEPVRRLFAMSKLIRRAIKRVAGRSCGAYNPVAAATRFRLCAMLRSLLDRLCVILKVIFYCSIIGRHRLPSVLRHVLSPPVLAYILPMGRRVSCSRAATKRGDFPANGTKGIRYVTE
jgi:hypothetical protein